MKIADAQALIRAYEDLARKAAEAIKAREALVAALGPAEVGKLADSFPDPDAFTAFVAGMPAAPKLEDVVKAFQPDTKDLADLVSIVMKGNGKLLAVIAEKGCGRDPKVLKSLHDVFKADPKPLQDMIEEGGLGAHPEAMAAMLQAGCDKDPAKLKALCNKFGVKLEREKLAALLGQGGLGQAPETVGALAKEGGGDMLKSMSNAFNDEPKRAKLRGLLGEGGCDAAGSGRPGLLADVVRDGLGGNPARLIELHDAFKDGGVNELPGLSKLLSGLDGDDGRGGARLGTLLATFKSRAPAATDAQIAKKLRDPYLKSISTYSMAGKVPPVIPPNGMKDGAAAASARPMPPPAQEAATLAGGIKDEEVSRLLSAALTDPERAQAASAAALTSGMGKRADAIAQTAATGDPGQTDKTKLATKAAAGGAAALAKRLDGGAATDIEALAKLGAAALEAAALEPDPATRTAALDAAKLVGTTVAEALRRLAAKALAGAPGADAATAATAALQSLDVTTPAAVKKAAEALARAGMDACAASNGAKQNPATSSAAAKAAIDKAVAATSRPAAVAKTKADAEAAAKTANDTAKMVTNAPRPVDLALLQRAAEAAAKAVAAGEASADEPAAKAAFDAAKALTAAIAVAVREAAGRFALQAAQGTAEGKAGLAAAADADQAIVILQRLTPPDPRIASAQKAAGAARAAALTGADTAALSAAQKKDLQKAAKDSAYRAAAATAGGAPDPQAITQAETAANTAAENAAAAANAAVQTLNSSTVMTTNPAAYATLIDDVATKAEAALAAARGAPDDTKRDAALLAAKNAAAAAAEKAKALAQSLRASAQTALNAAQASAITAAAGPRDALNLAAAQQAFDKGKSAIADAAAAVLAGFGESDAAVRTANETAAGKQTAAGLPGADENAKLDALIAARDAAQALATKAKANSDNLLTALPALPPNAGAMPADPERPFAAAMTALKAATGAASAWVAAAKAVEKAVAAFKTVLEKIDATVRTPAEQATLLNMMNAKNPARAATTAAENALVALKTGAKTLQNRIVEVPAIQQTGVPTIPAVPGWTSWANTNMPADPRTAKLQDIAGFALALELDAKVPARTEAEMIQTGPALKKTPYTGPQFVAEPCDGTTAQIDMAHITDRHVPPTYKFVPESSPKGSEHDIGVLLAGALVAKSKTAAQKDLIKHGKSNKKNSFFPETVDAAAALTMAKEALVKAGNHTAPSTVPVWLFNDVANHVAAATPAKPAWKHVWLDPTVAVNLPGSNPAENISCKVGIAIETDPGAGPKATPKVRMFYPDPGNMLSMPDVLVMAKALGVAS